MTSESGQLSGSAARRRSSDKTTRHGPSRDYGRRRSVRGAWTAQRSGLSGHVVHGGMASAKPPSPVRLRSPPHPCHCPRIAHAGSRHRRPANGHCLLSDSCPGPGDLPISKARTAGEAELPASEWAAGLETCSVHTAESHGPRRRTSHFRDSSTGWAQPQADVYSFPKENVLATQVELSPGSVVGMIQAGRATYVKPGMVGSPRV